MKTTATLEIHNQGWKGPFDLTFRAISSAHPHTITLDYRGKAIGRVVVTTSDAQFDLRIPSLPLGDRQLTLVASPGAARLGSSDARRASIDLTAPTLLPVVVWRPF